MGKIKILLACVLLFTVICGYSQKNTLGLNFGLSQFTGGFGGNIEYFVGDYFSLTAGLGLNETFSDTYWAVGVKGYVEPEENSLYGGVCYSPITKVETTTDGITATQEYYGPTAIAGYRIRLAERTALSLGVGFNYIMDKPEGLGYETVNLSYEITAGFELN